MKRFYPESKVETTGFIARHYDILLDIATLGKYLPFIKKVISMAKIKPEDKILDLGAGTGRNACLIEKYLSDKGLIVGVDICEDMIAQFGKRCADFPNAKVTNMRIDQPLPYKDEFNKVFISFVLHGFPQNARKVIIENAFNALKKHGQFLILDYNEFSLPDIPFYLRFAFRLMECPYAFDFIEKDLKKLLADSGFTNFQEHFFFTGFVRLLRAVKPIKS